MNRQEFDIRMDELNKMISTIESMKDSLKFNYRYDVMKSTKYEHHSWFKNSNGGKGCLNAHENYLSDELEPMYRINGDKTFESRHYSESELDKMEQLR